MPVIVYKVVYSTRRGVFLGVKDGKARWSRDKDVQENECAPVFETDREFLDYVQKNQLSNDEFTDTVLQEVFPTENEGGQPVATREDCATVGIAGGPGDWGTPRYS